MAGIQKAIDESLAKIAEIKEHADNTQQIAEMVNELQDKTENVIKNLEDQGVIRSGWAAKISVNLSGDNAEVAVAPGRLRELLTNLMENGRRHRRSQAYCSRLS